MDQEREKAPHGYVSLREYVDVRFDAQETAVLKSESAYDRRFSALNEMRGMLSDYAAHSMPRSEYETAHQALVEKVEALQKILWVGLGLVLAFQFIASILLIWTKQTHGQ